VPCLAQSVTQLTVAHAQMLLPVPVISPCVFLCGETDQPEKIRLRQGARSTHGWPNATG
jgi:hypothetical protein